MTYRNLLLAAAAALVLAFPASAASFKASLAVGSLTATTVDYDVTFAGKKNDNPWLLWVSQTCFDADGEVVSAEYHPVVWDALPAGHTEPFAVAGVSCSAAVTMFPDVWTPRSNTVSF